MIEQSRECGRDRVVKRYGVGDLRAVEADRIEHWRQRRDTVGAGRLGARLKGRDAAIRGRPIDRADRLGPERNRYGTGGDRGS